VYESCFQQWYTHDFLVGTTAALTLPCENEYAQYQRCVIEAMDKQNLFRDADIPFIDGTTKKSLAQIIETQKEVGNGDQGNWDGKKDGGITNDRNSNSKPKQ